MWILRLLLFWKSFWHRGQLTTAELRLWTSFECLCNAARDPKSFEQSLHWKSRNTSAMSVTKTNIRSSNFLGHVKPNVITAMHPFYVNFELLWLTEFPATEITQRSGALRISSASICSMHFQVVQSQEKLSTELTLIRALAIVKLLRVFHDIFFSQNGNATYFTMIFSDCKTETRVVENRTVSTVVKRMIET